VRKRKTTTTPPNQAHTRTTRALKSFAPYYCAPEPEPRTPPPDDHRQLKLALHLHR